MTLRVPLEAERERLGDILAHAFARPRDTAETWFERAGFEHLRVFDFF